MILIGICAKHQHKIIDGPYKIWKERYPDKVQTLTARQLIAKVHQIRKKFAFNSKTEAEDNELLHCYNLTKNAKATNDSKLANTIFKVWMKRNPNNSRKVTPEKLINSLYYIRRKSKPAAGRCLLVSVMLTSSRLGMKSKQR